GDPIWSDLARIVVADRDAGLQPGPELEQLRAGVAPCELLVGANELRHRRRERDAVDAAEVEEAPIESAQLVAALVPLRGDPPVLGQLAAFEQPEHRRRVADVYGKEHRPIIPAPRPRP